MSIEEVNINAIVEGCKRGDRKAQEQLYRSYYKAMMNLCLRYTKSESDAMSVLNTGFLKVFRGLDKFDSSKGSLYTWIRTVVVNNCLDQVRADKNLQRTGELEAGTGPEIDPEVYSRISQQSILEMVRQLAPATRAVFNLFALEGYGHKEIAQMLKISEGTSKWHFSEARKKLKHLIEMESRI
ncbi:MAG: sigma-70 family RNA polymerase sigma factor [Chitinophagaceae bacterium]|nr:MAG: sigma-70 family RNA polymerase sigma factor [Chitinophagaceae bacterium]